MKVQDVMTSELEAIGATGSVSEAARMMRDADVGVVPVLRDGRCVGIVTDRDITVRVTAEGKDPRTVRVEDVLTPDVISCRPDDDVERAAELMASNQVRRIAVLDDGQNLVGMLSLGDLATSKARARSEKVLEQVSKPS